jgi:hypothetical protein
LGLQAGDCGRLLEKAPAAHDPRAGSRRMEIDMKELRRFAAIALSVLSTPALADDVIRLTGPDLGVQTHKWDGKTIETDANCFYADKDEFRCMVGGLARIDFSTIEPKESQAFVERNCDTMEKVFHGAKCKLTIRFVYDGFDEMQTGGLFGRITIVKARGDRGSVVSSEKEKRR